MEADKEQDDETNIEKKDKNSEKKKIIEIINNVKPEIILEYCCGIFRFHLVDGELRPPSWKLKGLGILIILIYSAVFAWFLYLPDPHDDFANKNNIIGTVDVFPSFVVLFQYAASTIAASFFISSMNIRMLNLLAEVDTLLQVETFTDFYKKISSRLNKYLIILIITLLLNGVVDMCSVIDYQWAITVFPLYLIQKLEVYIFCTYVIMLNERLIIINNYLKEFIQEQDKKHITVFTVRDTKVKKEKMFNYIGRPSVRNLKVRDLATSYDNLGEIYSMVNDVFNFQIFITLVSAFTYIVITMWISLSFYRTSNYQIGQLINNMIWCFNTICNVAIMSFACERVLITRNETRILVNKIIMNYDLPKTMRVQAKAFMELVDAWPLRIYVYDMFSIDIKLMLKFISVATTYLIVIIQISHFI